MARHPEVSESQIIIAGKALSAKGKTPNPGTIRAELGDKGSLMRIKQVWFKYLEKQELSPWTADESSINFEELPSELIEITEALVDKLGCAVKDVVAMTFGEMQQRNEARYRSQEKVFNDKLAYYAEYEVSADQSINKLEQELDTVQKELEELASQNAKLLIENATQSGRLDELEKAAISHKTKQSKQAPSKAEG